MRTQVLGPRGAILSCKIPLSQQFAKARLAQAEFVRGGSSWTFVPKVDDGVTPHEGAAAKPKGSVVPKVNVGVAPCKGAATKPKGSVVPKVNVGVAPYEGAHRTEGLQPNPKDLSFPKLTSESHLTKGL